MIRITPCYPAILPCQRNSSPIEWPAKSIDLSCPKRSHAWSSRLAVVRMLAKTQRMRLAPSRPAAVCRVVRRASELVHLRYER